MTAALAGKAALITGASSGIGEGAALALAAAGASVAVSARRADRLDALVRRIESAGGKAIALPGDVAEEEVAKRAVHETAERFGRLDILVNSAGINRPGGVESMSAADYRKVIDINLMATFHTCHYAIPIMRKQGAGDIVNISSTAGRRAAGIFNAYSASKFGVNALSEGMRQEVGGHGIRVCIIEPGATTTEVAESFEDPVMRKAMHDHVHKEGAMKPEDIAAAILFAVTLPRRANVCEIYIRPTIDVAP